MSGHGKRTTLSLGELEYTYCPTSGKKRFETRSAAKRLLKTHRAKQRMTLYECRDCGGIHMTSAR